MSNLYRNRFVGVGIAGLLLVELLLTRDVPQALLHATALAVLAVALARVKKGDAR